MWGINRDYILTVIIIFGMMGSISAQSENYNYTVTKSASLVEIIEQLEKSFAIEFSFPFEEVQAVEISKDYFPATTLNELLSSLLVDTGLEFQIVDNRRILLRPKIEALSSENILGPERFKVAGFVYDNNKEPVAFANIALDTLQLGTTTNGEGYFEFEIPKYCSNRNIIFQYIGYQTQTISITSIQYSTHIYLQPTSLNLKEVVVVSKIPSLEIRPITNSTSARADYLNKMITPVISNDIIRGVQMMAGVSASNDASAEIKIRGSQADETLIMLDGIPIYKADHFYGIFGSVNGNHIHSATLHKNSIPINYGGKSGGMLELSASNYIPKAEGILDLNMLTSALTIKTPISKNLGIILSGRTTYDNAADSKIFNWVEPDLEEEILNNVISDSDRPLLLQTFPEIQFFDWNAKLIFNPSENHQLRFSLFNSQDDYQNAYDITFQNRLVNGQINGREEFNDIENSRNFGVSFQYDGSFANDWDANISLYHSVYDYSGSLSTSLELERNNNFFVSLTNNKLNSISDIGGHIRMSKNYDENKLSFGISAVNHDISFEFIADNTRSFEINPTGFESAIFGQYLWKPSDEWTVQFGNRLDYYSETSKVYNNPRLDISRKLSSNFFLKSSFSKNFQFVREITHYTRLREPIDIYLLTSSSGAQKYPVGSSTNMMIGAALSSNHWTVDTEFYYKDIDGVIEHTQQILGNNVDENKIAVRDYETVIGTGSVVGMDLTIGYEKNSFSNWLAYTLSKSTNRFEKLFQGEGIPSSADRRHQLKWSGQYRINNWLFHSAYVFSSGLNQINLFDLDEPLNLQDIVQQNTFQRLDPYHRLDLGMDYEFQLFNSKASIGLSVFNMTNNNNVDYVQYLFALPRVRNNTNRAALSGTTTQLLDRTFNLNFKVKW